MVIDSGKVTGSLSVSGSYTQTGNAVISGSLTVSGSINATITGSITTASYASYAETLDGLDSTNFTLTSSFQNYTSSANTRLSALEAATASLYTTTASLNASIAAILSFTASNTLTDATQSVRLSALEAATASLYTATASFSGRVGALEATTASLFSYTSSNDAKIASIYTTTSSLNASVAALNAQTASLLSFTASTILTDATQSARLSGLEAASASINSYTSSNDAKITSIYSTTSSLNASIASLNSYTASNTLTDATQSVRLSALEAATASLYTATSSFSARVGGLEAQSASLLSYTSSTDAKIASIYTTTSSLNASVASLNSYTSSTDAKIASIYSTTSSLNTAVGSLNNATASLNNFSSSHNTATASLNAAVLSLNNATSSIQTFTSSASTRLSALEAATASIYSATSSFSGRVGALESATASLYNFSSSVNTTTASLNTAVSTLNTYTSSINAKTSSFATTGSNTFIGTQTITGSLNISGSINSSGTITAQTLVVQVVTSSQNFITGSTKFGSVTINTHQFTGSVSASGSLNINNGVLYADGANVGIGTSSPSEILHIISTGAARIRLVSTAPYASLLDFYSGSFPRWSIGIDNAQSYGKLENRILATDAIRFYDSSNDVSIVPTSGKVGIGTTTAPSLLTIKASATDGNQIYIVQSNDNRGWKFRAKTDGHFYLQSSYNGADTDAIKINYDDGNVGIGTTSPSYKLDVSGSGRFAASGVLPLQVSGNSESFRMINDGAYISWYNTANSTRNGYIQGSTGLMNIQVASGGDINFGNGTDLVRITSGGNVGIGTTSVTQGKLVIAAPDESTISALAIRQSNSMTYGFDFALDQTVNGQAYIYSVNNGTKNSVLEIDRQPSSPNLQLVNSGGNVGIGITPSYHLDVKEGTASATLRVGSWAVMENVTTNQAMFGYNAVYQTSAGSGWRYINTGYAMAIRMHDAFGTGDMMFHLAASSGSLAPLASTWDTTAIKMIIKNDGNVGIGTTAPSGKLDIWGSNDYNQLWIRATTGNAAINFDVETAASSYYNWRIDAQGLVGNAICITPSTAAGGTTFTSPVMTITQGGNIGIGTTSPSNLLDVNGSGNIRGTLNVIANEPQIYLTKTGTDAGSWRILGSTGGDTKRFRVYDNDLEKDVFTIYKNSTVAFPTTASVGIGTTSPITILQVSPGSSYANNPTIQVVSSFADGYSAILSLNNTHTGGRNWTLLSTNNSQGSFGGGKLVIQDQSAGDATAVMTLVTGGNVGIGTTSPGAHFHVYSAGGPSLWLTAGGSGTGGLRIIKGDSGTAYINNQDSVGMQFQIAGSTKMTIDSGGSVGIGTTSPEGKLHVYASAVRNMLGVSTIALPTSGDEEGVFVVKTNSALWQQSIVGYAVDSKGLRVYNTGGSTYTSFEVANGSGTRLIVAGSGNVGIGTSSPTVQLSVSPGVSSATLRVGSWAVMENVTTDQAMFGRNVAYATSIGSGWRNLNTGGATAIRMYDDPGDASIAFHLHGSETGGTSLTSWDSTDVKMTIRNSGSVGIGTVSPSSLLHVHSSVGGRIARFSGPSTADNYISVFSGGIEMFMDADYTNSSGIVGTQSGHNLILRTNGDNRVWINTGGNVGINTSSPGAKLDVAGDINIDGSYFHKVGNSAIITAPSDQGLVAYYGFDEGSGTNISDKTGRNNTTSTNLTYTTTAIKGTALNGFGADANNVVVPNSSDFDFGTGDFAISLWCYPNSSFTNTLETLVEMGRYTAGILIRPHSNTIEVYAQGALITNPGYVLSIDTWHHIVVTRVSSTLSVFANGTRLIAVSNSSDIQVSDAGYIGRSAHTSGQVFHGIIDEVKFYKSRGLNYGEVRGQYLSRGETTLIAPILSNGTNIGIGTNSPSSLLHVNTTTAADNNGHIKFENYNSAGSSYTNAQLIGKSYYGTAQLMVWESYGIRFGMRSTTNGGSGDIYFTTGTDSVQMVIKGGSVGIGTTSPAYLLDVAGTIRATGDVIAYSDARVKENVNTITDALTKVTSMRGVTYTRNDSEDKSRKVGVIAQEVLPILPEVVQQDTNGNYSVAYGNMVGVLIEAIKEQQQQIDELKYLLQTINK